MTKKSNVLVIALCLVILICITWIFMTSKQYRQSFNPNNSIQQDPLFEAVHSKNYSIVDKLVKQDPGILKRQHKQGGTYMNCAAGNKDTMMMKLLIKLGGNPNGASDCGMAPLILASDNKDLAMVRILLEAGADPNIFHLGSCPLTTAKQSKNTDMIKLLLKYGAKEIFMQRSPQLPIKAKP